VIEGRSQDSLAVSCPTSGVIGAAIRDRQKQGEG